MSHNQITASENELAISQLLSAFSNTGISYDKILCPVMTDFLHESLFRKSIKRDSPTLIDTGKTSLLLWYIFTPFIVIPVISSAFLLIGRLGRMYSLNCLPC